MDLREEAPVWPDPAALVKRDGPFDRWTGHGPEGGKYPEGTEGWGDNPAIDAFFTYLGQYIDHDISREGSIELGKSVNPTEIRNLRTKSLCLEVLYGSSSAERAQVFENGIYGTLKIGSVLDDADYRRDLVWESGPCAVDPRTAQSLMLIQMHVAFIRFHNQVYADLLVEESRRPAPRHHAQVAVEAEAVVRRHYEWLIVRHYLPKLADKALIDEIVGGKALLYGTATRSADFIPIEFSAAAFRVGHAQVQSRYQLNENIRGYGLPLFPPNSAAPFPVGTPVARLSDLRGLPVYRDEVLDWKQFLSIQSEKGMGVRVSGRIARWVGRWMMRLPDSTPLNGMTDCKSLPERTLLKALDLDLPSGVTVAKAVHAVDPAVTVLSENEIWGHGFEAFSRCDAPLWFYLLAEAEAQVDPVSKARSDSLQSPGSPIDAEAAYWAGRGERLGRLGQRIVAEVILGILRVNPDSYLHERGWRPSYGDARGDFTPKRFLEVAGVLE